MAATRINYVGDGSTTAFAVTFPRISDEYVELTVNGTITPFTMSGDLAILSDPPAADAIVRFVRRTESASRLVDFRNGSTLTERDLDLSAQQVFDLAQEATDTVELSIGVDALDRFSALGRQLSNVADGTLPTDAATVNQVSAVVGAAAGSAAAAGGFAANAAANAAIAVEQAGAAAGSATAADGHSNDAENARVAAEAAANKAEIESVAAENAATQAGTRADDAEAARDAAIAARDTAGTHAAATALDVTTASTFASAAAASETAADAAMQAAEVSASQAFSHAVDAGVEREGADLSAQLAANYASAVDLPPDIMAFAGHFQRRTPEEDDFNGGERLLTDIVRESASVGLLNGRVSPKVAGVRLLVEARITGHRTGRAFLRFERVNADGTTDFIDDGLSTFSNLTDPSSVLITGSIILDGWDVGSGLSLRVGQDSNGVERGGVGNGNLSGRPSNHIDVLVYQLLPGTAGAEEVAAITSTVGLPGPQGPPGPAGAGGGMTVVGQFGQDRPSNANNPLPLLPFLSDGPTPRPLNTADFNRDDLSLDTDGRIKFGPDTVGKEFWLQGTAEAFQSAHNYLRFVHRDASGTEVAIYNGIFATPSSSRFQTHTGRVNCLIAPASGDTLGLETISFGSNPNDGQGGDMPFGFPTLVARDAEVVVFRL